MLLYGVKIAPTAALGVNQFTVSQVINLENVNVADIPPQDDKPNAFLIFSNTKSFTVMAETPEVKTEWMNSITNTTAKIRKPSNSSHGQVAPVWDPDSTTNNCKICEVQFTMFNRKHHCRHCGKVVCGTCSAKQFKLDYSGKMEKVCNVCFKQLTDAQLNTTKKKIIL